MISLELFLDTIPHATGKTLNAAQLQAVAAPAHTPLFIVAGPGTGKTAVLTLRILRLIFVDSIPPHAILATTFTRRAAHELRSRLISWGSAILRSLHGSSHDSPDLPAQLAQIELSHVQLGTLDSFCEQFLRACRLPGEHPSQLADPFLASTLLLRAFTSGRLHRNPLLRDYLQSLRGFSGSSTTTELRDVIQSVSDRLRHDLVDRQQLLSVGSGDFDRSVGSAGAVGSVDLGNSGHSAVTHSAVPASTDSSCASPLQLLLRILQHYDEALSRRLLCDFPALEKAVLARLQSTAAPPPAVPFRMILIDEYQDTNLLQEQIFFQLARMTHAVITVVGDDDQSLYRFRGATVDLFKDFPQRHFRALGVHPARIFLSENYRSTAAIIQFVNQFVSLDSRFQPVRTAGKPPLGLPRRRPTDAPVLGLFRDTPEQLAESLARFLHAVIHGRGITVHGRTIRPGGSAGTAAGDCALLCSSPLEYTRGPRPRQRLPLLLRMALEHSQPGIPIFNPRGRNLSQVPTVRLLGGLLLQCLDPTATFQQQLKGLSPQTSATLTLWRTTSTTALTTQPHLQPLATFTDYYGRRDPGRSGHVWPVSVPCIELLYALIHWLPELHDSPTGQLWFEVFTRQLHATEQLSRFRGRILTDPSNPALSAKSILDLLRHFLLPIAEDSIPIDESLIESLPRDQVNVLSIHQSKGLEFPLVIVDVGSDLQHPRPGNAFRRFPNGPATPHRLEDLLRPHSPLGTVSRNGTNRAFDDLYRQYFVAFSRPRDVLVLAGLNAARPGGPVPNVACGWDRTGRCHWQKIPWCEI